MAGPFRDVRYSERRDNRSTAFGRGAREEPAMWARPPVVEVVTSIALLSDSTTTRGEYLALATKRITGEWHFHGGKKKSGESMPDATRRETILAFLRLVPVSRV